MLETSNLLADMKSKGVEFKACSHAPVMTMAESEKLDLQLQGERCKNLFLQDRKGRKYLVVTRGDKVINLNNLRQVLGATRLSMASSDQLQGLLGVKSGALSPLAIVNDAMLEVELVIDDSLRGAVNLILHPLLNSMSVQIDSKSLVSYLKKHDREVTWCKLE